MTSIAQLVRELHLENGNIRDVEVVGSQTSTDVISLGKKLTHNCLSRLKSVDEYLVFDWGWTTAGLAEHHAVYTCTCGLEV